MSGFERALLRVSTALVTLTGAIYFYMKYLMSSDDPFSVLNHPWQPYVLDLHILVAPVLVFALGLIAREHIVGRLADPGPQKGRGSGVATILLSVPMVVSGYLIQVLTHPAARRGVVWVHVATGAAFVILLAAHLVRSRRKRAASGSRGAPGGAVSRETAGPAP
ncbi:MAG: hypothetical protein ACE5JH_06925 [Acidobacteriota bacterium]